MATTTPNYGWDVPTSTDYVKDGATAIETLGDDIDASMFSALDAKAAQGVLLSSTSFTAQSALTIDNVFTSAYTNYTILWNGTASAAGSLFAVLRASGADITSGYYNGTLFISFSSSAITGRGGANESGFYLTQTASTYSSAALTLLNPQQSQKKGLCGSAFRGDSNFGYWTSSETSFTTASTGIKIYPTSGTLTGTIQIYGMKK